MSYSRHMDYLVGTLYHILVAIVKLHCRNRLGGVYWGHYPGEEDDTFMPSHSSKGRTSRPVSRNTTPVSTKAKVPTASTLSRNTAPISTKAKVPTASTLSNPSKPSVAVADRVAPRTVNTVVKREPVSVAKRQARAIRHAKLVRRQQIITGFIAAAFVALVAIVGFNVIPHPAPAQPGARTYGLISDFTAGAKGNLKGVSNKTVTLSGGLQYVDLKVGTGQAVKATDTITVQYTGWMTDGTMFDTSANHGGTAKFPLNQVIPGWTQGIPGMQIGGERRLLIPAALAYGDSPPQGSGIPSGATLIFDVTIVSIP